MDATRTRNRQRSIWLTDQLVYNLPFEFNDYITGEIRDYVFDYAVIKDAEEEDRKSVG